MKGFLHSRWGQGLGAWVAHWYCWMVAVTTRWEVEGVEPLQEFAVGAPCVVVFWHEVLPAMPVLWLRSVALGGGKRAVVLASRHRDGRLIGMAVERFGIGQVAGSSSKGGAAGLRGLVGALEKGWDVGLTPDGPRGPRRVAAPGVAQLAAMTGAKVFCVGAVTEWGIGLKSWDEMRVPFPFGRGRLICAPSISVPRDNWRVGLIKIEAALTDCVERAGAGW